MSDLSDFDIEGTDPLEAFAASTAVPEPSLLPALTGIQTAAPERVIGAQRIAIKRNALAVIEQIKTLGEIAGEHWYYEWTVNAKGGGKDIITGPSIKLANDVARVYGNCAVEVRVSDLGDSWLYHARFTDYETGYSLERPFQQRKSQRSFRGDDDRGQDIAFQIGASKAIRNVIVNALQTFVDYALKVARTSMVAKIGKKLPQWIDRVYARLVENKVDPKRAERVIGLSFDDWTAREVAKAVGLIKGVQDGFATWDDAFPPLPVAGEPKPTTDDFAGAPAEPPKPKRTRTPRQKGTDQPAPDAPSSPDPEPQSEPQNITENITPPAETSDFPGDRPNLPTVGPRTDPPFPGDERPSKFVDELMRQHPERVPVDTEHPAYLSGRKRFKAGVSRDFIPEEYRDDPMALAQYKHGWQAAYDDFRDGQ